MITDHLRGAGFVVLLVGITGCGGGDDAEPPADVPADAPPQATQPAQPRAAAPTGELPEGVTAEQVEQGRQIFAGQGICFTCHASDATGSALAPNLTDGQWIWLDPAAGDMLTQIADLVNQGVPQPREYTTPMPPRGGGQLTDEQVQAVAAYVYSLDPRG